MRKILPALLVLALALPARADGPTMETVIADPASYAGKTLTFGYATLSGRVTSYDAGCVRKYYLTVESAGKRFEPGFFLAPPALADKLGNNLNPRQNYSVDITCKVRQVNINGFLQWHGVVTRVDLLDDCGDITQTIQIDKK